MTLKNYSWISSKTYLQQRFIICSLQVVILFFYLGVCLRLTVHII